MQQQQQRANGKGWVHVPASKKRPAHKVAERATATTQGHQKVTVESRETGAGYRNAVRTVKRVERLPRVHPAAFTVPRIETGETDADFRVGFWEATTEEDATLKCGKAQDELDCGGEVAFAAVCKREFAGSTATPVLLTDSSIRTLWVRTVGNAAVVPQGGVKSIAADRLKAGRGTAVLRFVLPAKYVDAVTWDRVRQSADGGRVVQGLCRRAAGDVKVKLDRQAIWDVSALPGRVEASVRVLAKDVKALLGASGTSGLFWRELSFSGGTETHAVVGLSKEVTLPKARSLARKLGDKALGLGVGAKGLFIRASAGNDDVIRAELGELAVAKRSPRVTYLIGGAGLSEHKLEVLEDVRQLGWDVSLVSAWKSTKEGQQYVVVGRRSST